MPLVKSIHTKYQCNYCRQVLTRTEREGRPSPGYCSGRPKDSKGRYQPHVWKIISRG